jgi:hypothetical protein
MPVKNGLFKTIWEFAPKEDWNKVPGGTRGIYVLFSKAPKKKHQVVYVGRSTSNIAGRLADHARSKRKEDKWDHYTVFKVHNKVSAKEIAELEQFILYVFRKDPRTLGLNRQKSTKALRSLRRKLPEA